MTDSSSPIQGRKPVSPLTSGEETAADATRILHDQVQAYHSKLLEKGLFSGGLLVALGDQPVFENYTSLDSTETFTKRSLFNSCSVSKLLTAVAIAQLNLGLNSKITDLGLEGPMFKDIGDVTIGELLNHTSGIIDIGKTHVMDPTKRGQFEYSNFGYQILAEIVKQKSPHHSFHVHVQKEIMERAKMEDALALQSQFDPSLPIFSSPDEYPEFVNKVLQEQQEIQRQLDALNQVAPQDLETISLKKELEKKLVHLHLPNQYRQLPSGKYVASSFVTPPTGNGCFYVSTADWMKFSEALRRGDLPSEALEKEPVVNPHGSPEEHAEYCSGFERRQTLDGKGKILYRHGNSSGSSASLMIIKYPGRQDITLTVNSNIGDSRGCRIADELCRVVQGQEVEVPLKVDVEMQKIYQILIKTKDFNGALSLMKDIPPERLLTIPLALAERGYINLAKQFLGSNSPLSQKLQLELQEKLADLKFPEEKDEERA